MAKSLSRLLHRAVHRHRSATRAALAKTALDAAMAPGPGQVYDHFVRRDEAVWALSRWVEHPVRVRHARLQTAVDTAASSAAPDKAAVLVAICLGAACRVRATHPRRGQRATRLLKGALLASEPLAPYHRQIKTCFAKLRKATERPFERHTFVGTDALSAAMHQQTCQPTPQSPAVLEFVGRLSHETRLLKSNFPWRTSHKPRDTLDAATKNVPRWLPVMHRSARRRLSATHDEWRTALDLDLAPFLLERYYRYGPAPQGPYTRAAQSAAQVFNAALHHPPMLRALVSNTRADAHATPRYRRDLIALAYASFFVGPGRLLASTHGPHLRERTRRLGRLLHHALLDHPALVEERAVLSNCDKVLDHCIVTHRSCTETLGMLQMCADTLTLTTAVAGDLAPDAIESARLLYEMVAKPQRVLM